MRWLELRIPPPIVALCVGVLMWLAPLAPIPLAIPLLLRAAAAVIFIVGGLGLALAGLLAFRRAKTTVNPMNPTTATALVTEGVFRHTRNPMYLGLLLSLSGWAAYLASATAFLLLPLFMLYIHRFQIIPEERALDSLFGATFAAYKAQVRRWL